MLIHGIVPVSRVNGPGERFAVWTQGCDRGCAGCFNPSAQKPREEAARYRELSVEEIISLVPAGKVSGITVSGGEPFEQPQDLRRLLAAARSLGLHTLVYSGYTYEELRRLFPEVLREIDILIDGPYMRDVPRSSAWAGSGNQRILCLRNGEAVLWDAVFSGPLPEAEVFIDSAGGVTVTGAFSLNL